METDKAKSVIESAATEFKSYYVVWKLAIAPATIIPL